MLLIEVESLLASTKNQWHVTTTTSLGEMTDSTIAKKMTLSRKGAHGYREIATIEGVIFSEKKDQLVVIDNPQQEYSLQEVMKEGSFIAGMNGGYFHPDGRPLGLLMHEGNILHQQEKARLLSGFFASDHSHLFLLRVGESIPSTAQEVIQAGPFLVDHHQAVSGLESTRIAWRSFLATNGRGSWMMGKISPVTLETASHLLMAASPEIFSCGSVQRALNLDGGSSTAFWAETTPSPFSFNENVHVRNFLGLKPQ